MASRAHFRVGGIPVRVEPVFWLIVAMFGFQARTGWSLALWVAVVFVSILVHELGHTVAYRIFGARASITLTAFAGLTHGPRLGSRGRRIAVSLAGPLTALLLVGLPARSLLEGSFGDALLLDVVRGDVWEGWYLALDDIVYVNVWWSLVNLLPIRPLDGGNVLSEIVGIDRARLTGVVVAAAGAAYAWSVDLRVAAFFAAMLGVLNHQEWRQSTGRSAGSRPGTDFGIQPPGDPRR